MYHNGERVIFTVNGDGTITIVLGISYEGEAEEFSWVFPVPSVRELLPTVEFSVDDVRNILVFDNELWIHDLRGVIQHLTTTGEKSIIAYDVIATSTSAIRFDDMILVGLRSDYGLGIYDGSRLRITNRVSYVEALAQSSEGVWAATAHGLYFSADINTWTKFHYPPDMGTLLTLVAMGENPAVQVVASDGVYEIAEQKLNRTHEFETTLADLLIDLPLRLGVAVNIVRHAQPRFDAAAQAILAMMRDCAVVGSDEIGARVAGRNTWQ